MYTIKEIFYTLQGEGANAGKAAVFVRFSGCNLWSGREQDRATAVCKFCDTDFIGGLKFATAEQVVNAALDVTPDHTGVNIMAVFTGGEPGLQLDEKLVALFRGEGFYTAIETNGTVKLPEGLDWICCSPKAYTVLALDTANELKLVYPQDNVEPKDLNWFRAETRWLSPMDGTHLKENTEKAVTYCLNNPEWRLNLQAHKVWSIP